MAKREIKKGICSFCIKDFPYNEMYSVEMPMHTLPDGSTKGIYRTVCCEKCIDKKSTKERILGISQKPKNQG